MGSSKYTCPRTYRVFSPLCDGFRDRYTNLDPVRLDTTVNTQRARSEQNLNTVHFWKACFVTSAGACRAATSVLSGDGVLIALNLSNRCSWTDVHQVTRMGINMRIRD